MKSINFTAKELMKVISSRSSNLICSVLPESGGILPLPWLCDFYLPYLIWLDQSRVDTTVLSGKVCFSVRRYLRSLFLGVHRTKN